MGHSSSPNLASSSSLRSTISSTNSKQRMPGRISPLVGVGVDTLSMRTLLICIVVVDERRDFSRMVGFLC